MASRNASFPHFSVLGILLTPLRWVVTVMLAAIVTLMVSWAVHGLCAAYLWPGGLADLRAVLDADLRSAAGSRCWWGDLGQGAIAMANALYGAIFTATGVDAMGRHFAQAQALSIPDTLVRHLYREHFMGLQVMRLSTQLVGIRLAMVAAWLPLMMLIYGVALADGLAQRAIRRARGGRESSGLYHRAKYFCVASMLGVTMGFLVWPHAVNGVAWRTVALAALSVLACGQWSRYKKHL